MERLHKITAVFVFVFVVLHLLTHLVGLRGIEDHDMALRAARLILRDPIIELSVLLVFFLQMLTGYGLSLTIWREKKDFRHQVYAASGTLFSLFFLIHMLHLAYGRFFVDIDPNFYFIYQSMTAENWRLFFLTSYGLGLGAFFVHMAVIAFDMAGKDNPAWGTVMLIIVLCAGCACFYFLGQMFTGGFYKVEPPSAYGDLFT
jgi:hypothetical protein